MHGLVAAPASRFDRRRTSCGAVIRAAPTRGEGTPYNLMLPCPIGVPGAVQDPRGAQGSAAPLDMQGPFPSSPSKLPARGRIPKNSPGLQNVPAPGGTGLPSLLSSHLCWGHGGGPGGPGSARAKQTPRVSPLCPRLEPCSPPKKLQSLPFPTREGNSLHLRQRSFGLCRRGAVQRRYLRCLGAGSRLIFITSERSIWNMNNANCARIDLA